MPGGLAVDSSKRVGYSGSSRSLASARLGDGFVSWMLQQDGTPWWIHREQLARWPPLKHPLPRQCATSRRSGFSAPVFCVGFSALEQGAFQVAHPLLPGRAVALESGFAWNSVRLGFVFWDQDWRSAAGWAVRMEVQPQVSQSLPYGAGLAGYLSADMQRQGRRQNQGVRRAS
jgi:hypothetical protein